FVDYQNTYVNPRTDLEYDGLNNIVREIVRGKNDNIETDDHITLYEYNKNGWLVTEKDAVWTATNGASGGRTEYGYDANGNVTRSTLKNRLDAGNASWDDITVIQYDSRNRQVRTEVKTQNNATNSTVSKLVSEIRYNGFGEITGKRSYVGTAPVTTNPHDPSSGWQEFAQYDQAGRVWKSNSGDGVTKVYLHDKQGNATLAINGTLDMRSLTFDQIKHHVNTDQQKTFWSYSLFDERNQLTNTIQPSMDGRSATAVIETNADGQSTVIRAPSEGSVTANNGANTNPITAGSFGITGGNASWSIGWDRGDGGAKPYYLHPTITIPSSFGLEGTTRLKISVTATNGHTKTTYAEVVIPQGETSKTENWIYIGNFSDVKILLSYQLTLVQSTPLGDVVLGETAWSGVLKYAGSGGGSISIPKKLYITGQPSTTSQVLLSYRPVGSNVAFTTTPVPQMINASGTAMPGMFAFDWNSIPADEYEYQYLALNHSGEILNAQGGTFNTSNPSAPIASPQTPILMGEAGGSVVSIGGTPSLASSGLQTKLDRMSVGGSHTVKFTETGKSWEDEDGPNGYYEYDVYFGVMQQSITVSNLPDTSVYGNGHIRVEVQWGNNNTPISYAYNGSPITATTSFNSSYRVREGHPRLPYGVPVSATIRIFKMIDGIGEILVIDGSISAPGEWVTNKNPRTIITNLPINTQQIQLQYRKLGSSETYSVLNAISLLATNGNAIPGYYTFNFSNLPLQNYEVSILALNSNGEILNQQLGQLNYTKPLEASLAVTSFVNGLQLIGQGSTAASVALRYRVKGSGSGWSEIPSSSFVPGGFGVGSFTLPTSALGVFVNGVGYDIEVDVR
ncbi:hypothetical protein ACW4YW_15580, partial [Methylobacillus pratensis]